MRHVILVLIAASTLALAACTHSSDPDAGGIMPPKDLVCTQEIRPGLVVEVRDAVTKAPAAAGAVGMIRDGAYEEMLLVEAGAQVPPQEALRLYGAYERRGTYDLLVEKPGYQAWARTDVVVTADECHVQTVRVLADLEPIP